MLLSREANNFIRPLLNEIGGDWKGVSGADMHRPSGRHYFRGFTLYEGEVGESGNEKLPILDISDDGLRVLDDRDGSVVDFGGAFTVRRLLELGAEVIRLDVSADWFGYEIDPFLKLREKRDYLPYRTSHLRDSRHQQKCGGVTIYFGSRESGGSFVRMYEKGAETGEAFPILRCELQAMHEKAHEIALLVYEGKVRAADGRLVQHGKDHDALREMSAVLQGSLDFRVGYGKARASGHASRVLKQAPAWRELVELLPQAVSFTPEIMRDRDFEAFLEWVEQCAPALWGKLILAFGAEAATEWIGNLAASERGVLSGEQVAAVERFVNSKSLGLWRERMQLEKAKEGVRWQIGKSLVIGSEESAVIVPAAASLSGVWLHRLSPLSPADWASVSGLHVSPGSLGC